MGPIGTIYQRIAFAHPIPAPVLRNDRGEIGEKNWGKVDKLNYYLSQPRKSVLPTTPAL
jgi:hypothetical protein